jgi:hypothetical protein
MAVVNAVQANKKNVGDPNAAYESLRDLWIKCRAVCSGERFVKDLDSIVDTYTFSNLLIPFSTSMTQMQYNFYKAEAELPGITAQFSKMLVGGLLRKQPSLELPEEVPEECYNWIMNEFGVDDCSLSAFLDEALWEEVQTNRSWIFVDYPEVPNVNELTKQELLEYCPYPILVKAESIINWKVSNNIKGKPLLERVIVKGTEEDYSDEFHPEFFEVIYVHELDKSGYYQIRVYKSNNPMSIVPTISGKRIETNRSNTFVLDRTINNIKNNGKRLEYIPAWPLNGNIEPSEPILMPIIDKEISLYNKLSRRNHLLYGAATYTPIICSDMTDGDFNKIVNGGLGSWIHLEANGKADILKTPTEALKDMESTIANTIEEMSKLGIRMLTPETAQSGVALEIRNAAQTAQLGTFNRKISNTLKQVIACMINWRYGLNLSYNDVKFSLSEDFNPVPLGADWLRLVTEWYDLGLIPRSIWLIILKANDIIPPDYDDEDAQKEINNDEFIINKNKKLEEDMEK